eukprot:GGOE01007214.1.p1 GENE.GGOE01007214.1~~GGOE01007214.1.p1  ORF type:complete len:171 (+),score=21.46 GGOE01007214.1:396-908(+)
MLPRPLQCELHPHHLPPPDSSSSFWVAAFFCTNMLPTNRTGICPPINPTTCFSSGMYPIRLGGRGCTQGFPPHLVVGASLTGPAPHTRLCSPAPSAPAPAMVSNCNVWLFFHMGTAVTAAVLQSSTSTLDPVDPRPFAARGAHHLSVGFGSQPSALNIAVAGQQRRPEGT